MGDLLRDVLLFDLFAQLFGWLLRLLVAAILVVLALLILCEQNDYDVFVSGIGNVCDALCNMPLVACPTERSADFDESECPGFGQGVPPLVSDVWRQSHVEPINIDGDGDTECLILYVRDSIPGGNRVWVSGVVYDPRPKRLEEGARTPTLDWPVTYERYFLSPRESIPGFLGQRDVDDWSKAIQIYDADGDGQDELIIWGFSGYGYPTYLSVFRWGGEHHGYQAMTKPSNDEPLQGPLWGDAGILVDYEIRSTGTREQTPSGPIERVVCHTRPFQRFGYLRSQLCHAHIYRWNRNWTRLEHQDDYYLTFCGGRPKDLSPRQDGYSLRYPEQALLAWYWDGEVRDIEILPQVAEGRLQAVVTLRQGSRHNWLVTSVSDADTDEDVPSLPFWRLQKTHASYRP